MPNTVFEATFTVDGTRFFVVVQTLSDGSMLIALPDFRWCIAASAHAAPSHDWLMSQRFPNRVDAKNLAIWLKRRWADLVGEPASDVQR